MAHPSTLYRFRIDLSDIDRGVYENLDFRIALHPSESLQYLLTRILAFALNAQEGLEFSAGGLADPDSPALLVKGEQNSLKLWIEIGNPSARKLHRAAKSAPQVKVYTYKDAAHLLQEMSAEKVYQAERIEVYAFSSKFLDRVAATLQRDNSWNVLFSDGTLTVSTGEFSESVEVAQRVSS